MGIIKKLVTLEHYWGLEEWYTHIIECPNCSRKIVSDSNYCNECGIAVKLTPAVEQEIKNERF